MRKLLLALLILAFNPTFAQLGGDYTINPSGSGSTNYTSFDAAVSALISNGVDDPVRFHVSQGNYNEQLTVPLISGASFVDDIVFLPDSNNTSSVTLTFAATCPVNYVISFNGANHIKLEGMQIENTGSSNCGTAIDLRNDANDITLLNCEIVARESPVDTSAGVYIRQNSDYVWIEGCTIEGGDYGINQLLQTTTPSFAYDILNNEIFGHTIAGVYLRELYNVSVLGNYIHSTEAASFSYGLNMNYIDEFEIKSNRIISDSAMATNGYRYGMYLNNCLGTSLLRSQIYNNCIQAGYNSSTTFGAAMYLTYSGLINMYHNTISARAPSSLPALSLFNGGLIDSRNNILSAFNGQAMTSAGIYTLYKSNNNVFASQNANPIYYGENFSSLAVFAIEFGYDSNSVVVSPDFIDAELDCRLCNDTIDNAGDPEVSVGNDIYGTLRNPFAPDPGAYEFTPAEQAFLGPDTTHCQTMLDMTLSAVDSVYWSINGSGTSSDTITLTPPTCDVTTFNVQAWVITEFCGIGTDAVNITLVPKPQLLSDTHLCKLDTLAITACADASAMITWSTGDSVATTEITQPNSYHVKTKAVGCTYRDTIVVTESDQLALEDIEECEEIAPIAYDASIDGGISYQWNGGIAPNMATNIFNESGTYSLTVTDSNGCTQIDSMEVWLLPSPEAVISFTYSGTIFLFDASNSLNTSPSSTYFWNFGAGADPPTSTSPTQTVVYPWPDPNKPASYSVSLEVNNNCGNDIATVVLVDIYPGIGETSAPTINLYPNPTKGPIQLSIESEDISKTLTVSTIEGRRIKEHLIEDQSERIDLSDLESGVYILSIGEKRQSVVLQH